MTRSRFVLNGSTQISVFDLILFIFFFFQHCIIQRLWRIRRLRANANNVVQLTGLVCPIDPTMRRLIDSNVDVRRSIHGVRWPETAEHRERRTDQINVGESGGGGLCVWRGLFKNIKKKTARYFSNDKKNLKINER